MMLRNLTTYIANLSGYLEKEGLIQNFTELTDRPNIIDEIEAMVESEEYFETKKFPSIYEFRLYRITLYLMLRGLKPNIVVETGVLHGLTTQFLLSALYKNQSGRLISIDCPSYFGSPPANTDGFTATLPPKREPGWVVSPHYRDRWELHLGTSENLLQGVLKSNREIDFFIHDSNHTYATMWFELNTAWEELAAGGVLVCDNVDCNTAFFDFCLKVGKIPFAGPSDVDDINSVIRFGIVKK